MPEVTIVYWRDIPAQVIVGKGRRGSKIQLTERFEQAIDRCAMMVGARDTDSYLAEWRKAAPYEVEGDQDEIAKAKEEADKAAAIIKANPKSAVVSFNTSGALVANTLWRVMAGTSKLL